MRNGKTWAKSMGVNVNNLAVKHLREVKDSLDAAEKVYDGIVKVLGKTDEKMQLAVLLAAASDYTFNVLSEQASKEKTFVSAAREKKIAERRALLIKQGVPEKNVDSVLATLFPKRTRKSKGKDSD